MGNDLLTIAYMSGFHDGKKAVSSHAVLAEVRADIQKMIDLEKEDTKDKPWMRQAQYRLAGLEDALAVIDKKITVCPKCKSKDIDIQYDISLSE